MGDQPSGNRFATLALHAGAQLGAAAEARDLYRVMTASEHGRDRDGGSPPPVLGSDGAVAQMLVEERIAALEGGSAAVAVASGASAVLVALQALLQPGDEIVASCRLATGLRRQFGQGFGQFGWGVRWADPKRPETFVEALSDRTRAIFAESLAHSGALTDIAAIARVAKRARIPLLIDNALATPYLVRPIEHGADVVLHSATAALAGRDGLGGLIVDGGSFDWESHARFPALANGERGEVAITHLFGNFAFAVACREIGVPQLASALHPMQAHMLLVGLETLALRARRQSESALLVARHLAAHPAVERVLYPGLEGDPGHALARRCSCAGAGAALSLRLTGGARTAHAVLARLRLVAGGTEWGGTRSIAALPASLSSFEGEDASGLGPDAIRLSIGLEDEADIMADLDQALAS